LVHFLRQEDRPSILLSLIKDRHEYIYYYDNKRSKLKLKGMSPVEYRTHSRLELSIKSGHKV